MALVPQVGVQRYRRGLHRITEPAELFEAIAIEVDRQVPTQIALRLGLASERMECLDRLVGNVRPGQWYRRQQHQRAYLRLQLDRDQFRNLRAQALAHEHHGAKECAHLLRNVFGNAVEIEGTALTGTGTQSGEVDAQRVSGTRTECLHDIVPDGSAVQKAVDEDERR